VDGDPDGDARPDGGDLFEDLEIHLVRLSRPAVLLGERQAEQSAAAERAEDVPGELGLRLRVGDTRRQLLRGEQACEPDEFEGFLGGQGASGGHGGLPRTKV